MTASDFGLGQGEGTAREVADVGATEGHGIGDAAIVAEGDPAARMAVGIDTAINPAAKIQTVFARSPKNIFLALTYEHRGTHARREMQQAFHA